MREQAELLASLDRRIKALEQLDSLSDAGLRLSFHPKDTAIDTGNRRIDAGTERMHADDFIAATSVMIGSSAASGGETGVLGVAEKASAPTTPSSGWGYVYAKTDGKLYYKNDAGTETALT